MADKSYKRRKGDNMKTIKIVAILVGILGSILGVIGGTVTIGDRLWADKMTVAKIETTVEYIKKDVAETKKMQKVVYDAFMEAAKHAEH